MSTINYTYNVIVDRFRQFAAGHFQLRRFTHGEISQADLEKEAEWPWLHVKPRAINYSPGTRSFSFEIFISDLPRDKEDKTGYQAESITDCSLIFQDLINEIYLGNMFGSDVVLTRPVNAEPFVEQYTHTLTGVTGTIELNLDYDWSACSIPASWNYNTPTDSPSDGWGALQFIESLDQNGVFVSLLNDEEAPGNSYYYGTNASGVKGWYAIVDNVGLTCETLPDCATIISIVDDIAALQSDVALKANTADLGATAFSNDYNDLDNLPTIPAQYNPTAGTGVSITGTYPNQTITNTAPDQTVALTAGTNIGVTGTYPNFTISNTQSLAGYVPTTRSITINGTTQDLSADRTFTIATGLTVGTTPITSGTVGRVLFEGTGNVLQESANFFWDNTNSRLGIGTASPGYGISHIGTIGVASFFSQRDFGFNSFSQIAQRANYIAYTTDGNNGLGFGAGAIGATLQGFTGTLGNPSAKQLILQHLGGNVLIGTTTDAGFKLDVNGTTRLNGATTFPNATTINGSGNLSIGAFVLHGGFGFATFSQTTLLLTGATFTSTSGTQIGLSFTGAFNPTSGTATYAGFSIVPTINQTGGANGITRGIYINPTLTAAADFRAIENSVGKVCLNTTSGNTLIGTTTDAGYKLDVNGTARVNGVAYFSAYSTSVQRLQFNNGNVASNIGYIRGVSDGIIRLLTAAEDTFNRLQFGGGTSAFPAIQRSGSALCIVDAAGTFLTNLLIGTTTDVASSKLTIESTTQGFLPPRMTTTQKNAIATPAAGLVVYDTTLNKLCVYTTAWETITSV